MPDPRQLRAINNCISKEFAAGIPISLLHALKALDDSATAARSEVKDKSPPNLDAQNTLGKDARAKVHDFVFVSFCLPCINVTT